MTVVSGLRLVYGRRHVRVSPLAMAIGATLSGIGANPSFAQDAGLEEIVVTSRYREENIQTTPISITAFTGEELEVRSIENLADIGRVVPNAYFRRNASNFGPNNTVVYAASTKSTSATRSSRRSASTSTTCITARSRARIWTSSTWSESRCCGGRRARCSARTASAARSACSRKSRKATTRARCRRPSATTSGWTSRRSVISHSSRISCSCASSARARSKRATARRWTSRAR